VEQSQFSVLPNCSLFPTLPSTPQDIGTGSVALGVEKVSTIYHVLSAIRAQENLKNEEVRASPLISKLYLKKFPQRA
jgi:hypothetical protein